MIISVTKWEKTAFALTIVVLLAFSSNYFLSSTFKNILREYHNLCESVNQTETNVYHMKNQLMSIKDQINSTKEQIAQLKLYVEENSSVLRDLQEGNEYELHDPLYEEAKAFIENDTSETIADAICHAKSLGIRCAYTQIVISNNWAYELIAFDTVDKGMVYFDPVTDIEVKPEIGKNYTECIIGQPYLIIALPEGNDTITDIIIVW